MPRANDEPSPLWFVVYLWRGHKQYVGPHRTKGEARQTVRFVRTWKPLSKPRVVWRMKLPKQYGRKPPGH